MKTLKVVSLAAMIAVSALNVRAAYTIGVTTSPTITADAGASGQSYFDFTFSGGGQFTCTGKQLWAVDPSDPGTILFGEGVSPFSSLTIDPSSTLKLIADKPNGKPPIVGTKYDSGSTYRLVVNWTIDPAWIAGGQYGIYFNLLTLQPDGAAANAGATDLVNINEPVSVPEPSQVFGASLIFGCGVLAFTGRRWMKKKVT
jgi:hypothetical protein